MRHLLMVVFVLALLGTVVWAVSYQVTEAELIKIAGVFLIVLIILAIIYIRSRSRRRQPPPPV